MNLLLSRNLFFFVFCIFHFSYFVYGQKPNSSYSKSIVPRVPVTLSDTVDCSGLIPVPLAGNVPANELVRSYCTGRCAEVTGQSVVPRAATFDFILASIDTVGNPGTLNTLTPLELIVCGKSLEEINQLLWPLLIRAGVCDTKASCGLDEDVELVNPSTGDIECNQYPERETANPFALDAVTIVFGILLIAVMLLIAGLSWYRVNVTKQKLVFEQKKFLYMKQNSNLNQTKLNTSVKSKLVKRRF